MGFLLKRYLSLSPPDWNFYDLLRACACSLIKKDIIENLEITVKEALETSHVIITDMGRTALTIGLKAMGLESNAGVIMPTMVCPTVIKAVLQADCRPILVDVEKNLHLSIKTLTSCQDGHARVIVVPHLYGLSAPIPEITEWAKGRNLLIIDDAAQAAGISLNGKYLGNFGDFGVLSFGPFKSLSTTRGGALVSNRNEIITKARKNVQLRESFVWPARRILGSLIKFHLRPYFLIIKENFNQKKTLLKRNGADLNKITLNNEMFRLSEIEACLIESALRRISLIISRRRAMGHKVSGLLERYDKFELVGPPGSPYIKVPIQLVRDLKAEEAVSILRSMRIEAERIYCPLHLYQEYRVYASQPMPISEEIWKNTFLVPNPVSDGPVGLNRLYNAVDTLNHRLSLQ